MTMRFRTALTPLQSRNRPRIDAHDIATLPLRAWRSDTDVLRHLNNGVHLVVTSDQRPHSPRVADRVGRQRGPAVHEDPTPQRVVRPTPDPRIGEVQRCRATKRYRGMALPPAQGGTLVDRLSP